MEIYVARVVFTNIHLQLHLHCHIQEIIRQLDQP